MCAYIQGSHPHSPTVSFFPVKYWYSAYVNKEAKILVSKKAINIPTKDASIVYRFWTKLWKGFIKEQESTAANLRKVINYNNNEVYFTK